MTEIEYEVVERDLLAFNEYQLQYSKDLKDAIRRNQSRIPGIIAVIALFYWFYYQDVITAFYIGIIGVSWGLLVPTYIRWNVLRKIKTKYTDEDKAKILGTYTLRLEPNVLIEITPDKQVSVKWSDVLRIEVTKKHAFVFVDVNEALIIPKKAVKRGNFREFVNKVDGHIEAAAAAA